MEEEKNGCVRCCHTGKASEHKKNGCRECYMTKGCSENFSPEAYKNLSDERKKEVNLELSLRRKAVTEPSFPNQEAIDEFLSTEQILTDFDASWKQPNLCRFINFSSRMLEWEVEYGLEKIFPMLARWILQRSESIDSHQVFPKEIVKKRVLKGIASYELAWSITDPNLTGFLALISETPPETFSSCEPQTLISKALPDLHKAFVEKVENKGKKPRKTKKNGGDLNEVDGISGSQKVKKIIPECSSPPVDFIYSKDTQSSCESALDFISNSQGSRKRNSSEMKAPVSPTKIPHVDTFSCVSIDPPLIELSDSDTEEVNIFKDADTASPARKKFSPDDSQELNNLEDVRLKDTDSPVGKNKEANDFVEFEDAASPVGKKFVITDSLEMDNFEDIINQGGHSPERNDFEDIKYRGGSSPEKDDFAEIRLPARIRFSSSDSPEKNDFDVLQCRNLHYEPGELCIGEPGKKEEAVNFSLGLESFCNMTLDVTADDESGSDSDISIIVERIMARKPF